MFLRKIFPDEPAFTMQGRPSSQNCARNGPELTFGKKQPIF